MEVMKTSTARIAPLLTALTAVVFVLSHGQSVEAASKPSVSGTASGTKSADKSATRDTGTKDTAKDTAKDTGNVAANGDSESGSSNSASTDFSNSTSLTGPGLQNSTTASLPLPKSQIPSKPFKVTLYTRTEIGRDAIDNNESTSTGFSWIGAAYSLSPTKVVAVRQEFLYSRPKTGESGDYKVRDLFFGFNNTILATFAGDGSVTSISRIYLPTGEDSRYVTKTQGQVLQWLLVNKPFGKWSFDYSLVGIYFNQSQDSYLNPKGVPTANLDYDIESWLGATYNFTPWLSVFQTAGTDNIWKRPIPGAGVQRGHALELETGVTVKPVDRLTVSATLFNYANIWDSKDAFHLYRDNETIYRFVISTTM